MFVKNINLDYPQEVTMFLDFHGTNKGRRLANALGFHGAGCVRAANALSNYAWNKWTAMQLRESGKIDGALLYERICDQIYQEDILGKIECW